MAMALPVGDQESERMLGARPVGRPVSARTTGLMPLNVEGKRSFFKGREVFGGAMVEAEFYVDVVVLWVVWLAERIERSRIVKLELAWEASQPRSARQLE